MDALKRLAMLLVMLGCTPLEPGDELRDVGTDAADAMVDAGEPDAGPSDSAVDATDCIVPPTGCPPLCAREVELLGNNLGTSVRIVAADQRLTCDKLYRMPDPTYVEPGATLIIEPGVVIEAGSSSFLAVQSGARLIAEGTREEPIVFTSSNEDPQPGDWPGVLLFGAAPTNADDVGFLRWVDEARADYGGTDEAHDCGSLRYVRLEYAGRHRVLGAPVDFVALATAGCGTETNMDYVQIHATRGEATEFLGGGFPVRHMVISEQRYDDAINWNLRWLGSIQWLIVHHSDDNDENSIEGRVSAFPIPDVGPAVANATLINPYDEAKAAMYLTAASGMQAFNVLVWGSEGGSVIFPDTLTNPGFFDLDHFTLESTIVDDAIPFALDDAVLDRMGPPMRGNRSTDPMLDESALVDDLVAPDFRPDPDGPANEGAVADLEGRVGLETTDYIGAIDPDGEDWTAGWTRY